MFKQDTSLRRTVGSGPEGVRLTKIVRTQIMHLSMSTPWEKCGQQARRFDEKSILCVGGLIKYACSKDEAPFD